MGDVVDVSQWNCRILKDKNHEYSTFLDLLHVTPIYHEQILENLIFHLKITVNMIFRQEMQKKKSDTYKSIPYPMLDR